MFSRTKTTRSTRDYSREIERLKAALNAAETVVIGAGAGLSTAAGFTYSGERFRENFADFEEKYDFHDMYSGGFYPFETAEEFWAFWSRNIMLNRYTEPPRFVYRDLFELVEDKDYFVLTTNVDHCFQKSGFDKKRLFYTQGDYGLFQCSEPCCNETFDNEKIVKQMYELQQDMKIPSELLPKCPHCGKPLVMNLRADDKFVEDEGWHKAAVRYSDFIRSRKNSRVLYLELGVGYNTPVIIKYPFWQLTAANPKATYACVNLGDASCPQEIAAQSILIDGDIAKVLDELILIPD
ncbi:MAG: Sir2 silent information regulator family NAD-dependent deacetylase [Oscillospiraceae bacterium]|nr:Sir2 silent information regulator family NAD-dependent deacetylase [Oscillospiraceae bacterium]